MAQAAAAGNATQSDPVPGTTQSEPVPENDPIRTCARKTTQSERWARLTPTHTRVSSYTLIQRQCLMFMIRLDALHLCILAINDEI